MNYLKFIAALFFFLSGQKDIHIVGS